MAQERLLYSLSGELHARWKGRRGLLLGVQAVNVAHTTRAFRWAAQKGLVGPAFVLSRAALEQMVSGTYELLQDDAASHQSLERAALVDRRNHEGAAAWETLRKPPPPPGNWPSLQKKLDAVRRGFPGPAGMLLTALHFVYDDASEHVHGSPQGVMSHIVEMVRGPADAMLGLARTLQLAGLGYVRAIDATASGVKPLRKETRRRIARQADLLAASVGLPRRDHEASRSRPKRS